MAEPLTPEVDCLDCGHYAHPLRSCHEIIGAIGGDPSNGPDYCPCSVEIGEMEQALEAERLRADAATAERDALAEDEHAATARVERLEGALRAIATGRALIAGQWDGVRELLRLRDAAKAALQDTPAPEPAEPIDVERLATILHDEISHYQQHVNPQTAGHRENHIDDARRITARLSQPESK